MGQNVLGHYQDGVTSLDLQGKLQSRFAPRGWLWAAAQGPELAYELGHCYSKCSVMHFPSIVGAGHGTCLRQFYMCTVNEHRVTIHECHFCGQIKSCQAHEMFVGHRIPWFLGACPWDPCILWHANHPWGNTYTHVYFPQGSASNNRVIVLPRVLLFPFY